MIPMIFCGQGYRDWPWWLFWRQGRRVIRPLRAEPEPFYCANCANCGKEIDYRELDGESGGLEWTHLINDEIECSK